MVETRDGRSLGEAAEAAAAAGDLDGAARILRELAELQHASLGADHPELAHTLNNLGVVHERLAHFDEAELCYRRAHAIALATLAPGHPFVETSGRNLREFCAAIGRPVEPSVATAPAVATSPVPPATEATSLRLSLADASEQPPPAPRVAASPPGPPPAPPRSRRGLVAAVVGIALILAGIFLARVWSESRAGAGFNAGAAAEPVASPPPTPETVPAPAPAPAPPPAAPVPPPAMAKSDRVPAVVEARVCSRLSTAGPRWNCEAVRESAGAGTLFFYTRLKSTSNAVVEHRWYQGERLHRTVELRLTANTGSGYRTFSRQTITPARAGDWRVELRAQDGTLLDEERFTVRPSRP